MIEKDNFFKNYFYNSSRYKKNLKQTKVAFKIFLEDIKNKKIPVLETYEKSYKYNFSPSAIKKFSKYKNIIIIGMGGSILGTKSIYSFFKTKVKKKVFFFDNLDLNLKLKFIKILNLKNSCFIVISKSGNTLETVTNLNIIFSKSLFLNKLIIITEFKNNILTKFANKFNAEIIEHRDFIGGRYSVMSEVGMLPASLMNLNIANFKSLKKLIRNKKFISSLIISVSSIYTLYQSGFKNSVILNYDSSLNDLCLWHQQLTGESLGKLGKGITPIISQCPKDHHSLFQLYLDGPKDKFFTFFSSAEHNSFSKIVNAQCKATKNVFKKDKIPYREFIFKKNAENELGSIFTFFVLETLLLAKLLRVNPFNQPGVEKIKIETKKILGRR